MCATFILTPNSNLANGYPSSICVKDELENSLIKIQGFADGNAGISLNNADGTKYRIFLNADGRLRYGKYINAWNVSDVLTNDHFLTKIVSLNQVTVPANAGITGSTTNISGQIPSGYKLLDAREVGSGNNGCYIYYFKVDGTNIILQLRNVTNAAITTSPSAQLLLIPK